MVFHVLFVKVKGLPLSFVIETLGGMTWWKENLLGPKMRA